MAFPHVWSATEDNQPTGSTPIGQGDDYIAATRQMVRERIGLEHNFDFTNDAEQGSHREGSARVWVSETEPEDPIPAVTAETVGQLKKGRFWFKPSTGEAFVYDLGTAAWKAINITGAQLIGLVTALSAKSTVAAADKILILDSSAGGAGKLITADKFATAAQGVKADAALPASSYTAADVLTKIKTVDGAGSGLDADTVDGQQASAFQPASSAINTSNIGSQSVSNADTVDGQHASAFATAAQGVKADNALPAASYTAADVLAKVNYTAADVLAKVKTVDGVGSGLDADLLRGSAPSAFATAAQGTKADNALPASSYTAADVVAKIAGQAIAPAGVAAFHTISEDTRAKLFQVGSPEALTRDFRVKYPIFVSFCTGSAGGSIISKYMNSTFGAADAIASRTSAGQSYLFLLPGVYTMSVPGSTGWISGLGIYGKDNFTDVVEAV